MTQETLPTSFRLGTRGSRLALVQAEMVRSALSSAAQADCELVILKTSGDRIQDRTLADIGGKGLFTKELEDALFRNEVDLAVHSMKDVPAALPAGLVIAAVLPREDVRDAFVSRRAPSLETLPKNARVGTSSVRRTAQLSRERPDLAIVPLRGNVDTRLAKLDSGALDAIILAHAGLKRLGFEHRVTALMPAENWLPALSQGAIGIEVRGRDENAIRAASSLNHRPTEIELACERAFQAALDGSCRTPIAGLARFAQDSLTFRGEVLAPDGKDWAATAFTRTLDGDAVRQSAAAGTEAGLAIRPRVQAWLRA